MIQMNQTQDMNTTESSANLAQCGLFIKQLEDLITANQDTIYFAPNVEKLYRGKSENMIDTV